MHRDPKYLYISAILQIFTCLTVLIQKNPKGNKKLTKKLPFLSNRVSIIMHPVQPLIAPLPINQLRGG